MKKIISVLLIILFLSACGKIPTTNNNLTTATSNETRLSDKEQDILKNGYQVGNYRFKLLGIQKNDKTLLSKTLSNIDVTIKNNFEEVEKYIDSTKKVDLLPTLANYDDINEKLTINYFLVNNSSETIKSIQIKGLPEFQNIKSESDVNTSFSEKEFTTLKQNEFVAFTLTFNIDKKYIKQLSEIKNIDLKVNITELEINGKKTDNSNQ